MIKIIFGCLLVPFLMFAQEDREVEYIRKYAKLAVSEMHTYKIPASITLAQGILETGGGQSRLAEKANNHFGIKCKKEWTGETITHDDDAIGECFRKYNSVEESYRDHSKFLAERPYYKNLFKLDLYDYKAWSHGLKKAGYATNPRYGYILISKIKKHKLYEFDRIATDEVESKLVSLYGKSPYDRAEDEVIIATKPLIEPVVKNNDLDLDTNKLNPIEKPKAIKKIEETEKPTKKTHYLASDKEDIKQVAEAKPKTEKVVRKHSRTKKMHVPKRRLSPRARLKRHPIGREYVVVNEGETLNEIAKMYRADIDDLLRFNELEKPEDLQAGQYIFFARKKGRGAKKTYKVQQGDTMYLIAQKAGIRLSRLYSRNNMEEGQEPKVGEVLYLIGRKPKK